MNLSRPFASSAIALLVAGVWLAPLPEAGLGTAAAQTAATTEIGDDELQAFARATLSMAALRDSYTDRIATAGSEAEQQALIEEGNAAIVTAIEDEPGMDLERYVEISEAAQSDSDLNARIVATLQDVAGEG
jgi:hypothetical protein